MVEVCVTENSGNNSSCVVRGQPVTITTQAEPRCTPRNGTKPEVQYMYNVCQFRQAQVDVMMLQVWDVILLENNVELLELRMQLLDDVVDKFVVAEMPFSMVDNTVQL